MDRLRRPAAFLALAAFLATAARPPLRAGPGFAGLSASGPGSGLGLPETPDSLHFDPTSIKSLGFADPSECVPPVRLSEPGPFGTASFSIALRLPPGRAGMTPALALSYSSDASGGPAGRGFDIELSAIKTETRFGAPRYGDSDIYLLDGQELVRTGRDGRTDLYRPRVEQDFRRIRRDIDGNSWEITEKSGRVREYGFGEGWIGSSEEERDRIYAWYLTKERDAFGNTIEYAYDRRDGYAYPAELRYTGNEALGAQGAYRLVFSWETRKDRRQDCCGGFFSTLGERLSRVDILFRDSLVRSYHFEYAESLFGQSLLERFVETDAEGREFYAYGFEYNELEKSMGPDGVPGYLAFEQMEPWGGGGADALESTRTVSGGASLYAGVQLRAPILGIVLASFGLRGGFGSSATAGDQVFADLNGDGIGDVVRRSGDGVAAYLGTGRGFSESPVFLGGIGEGSLDREHQTSAFLGASAGLLGATGALTKHYTWTESRTAFSDVDGDGYLDFLSAGSGSFCRGDGKGFSPLPWTSPALPVSGSGESDPEAEEEYRRIYYVQAPLRKWKACRSGEVEIRQSARLVDAGASSPDGVVLRTFAGGGETGALALCRGAPEWPEEARSRTLVRGENLYFLLDPLDEECGDAVDWDLRIAYKKAAVFEELAERGCLCRPPDFVPGPGFPYEDALKALYVPDGVSGGWRLQGGWRALSGGETLVALAMAGFAVPGSIPREDFLELLAFCDAVNKAGTITVESGQSGRQSFDATERELLRAGYDCIPETGRMRRNRFAGLYSDALVARCLPRLGKAAVRSILGCPWPLDAETIFPAQEAEGLYAHRLEAPERLRTARMDAEPGEGEMRPDHPLVLDLVNPGRPEEEAILLSFAPDGSPEISLACASETVPDPGAQVCAAAAPDGSELRVSFRYRGVERRVRFSEGTGLIQSLPAQLYARSVLSRALARAGERCSAENVETLDGSVRDAVAAGPDAAARTQAFDACYELSGSGRYALRLGVSEQEYAAVLLLLDPLCHSGGSLLDSLPGDPPGFRRIVLLDDEEAATLSDAGGTELSGALGEVVDPGGTVRLYVRLDASLEAREALEAAMTLLRCDTEGVFPFYGLAGSLRVLEPGADEAAVEAVMEAAGLRVWTRAEHSIVYRSSDLLDLEDGALPDGAEEMGWAPVGDLRNEPGQETGIVRIPAFDALGRSVLALRYVHVFDSGRDCSARDLVGSEPTPELAASVTETFRGGVRGWYYGVWSGYYPFEEGLLSRTPSARNGEATPPPYFAAMEPNAGVDGSLRVAGMGRNREPVPADAWVGPVSEYSETGLDSSLNAVGETWVYAALVRGRRLCPARNGGEAYHALPRETDGGANSLAFLEKSRSVSLDINGGVGIAGVGASLGKSSGVSWQYRGLADMNGDRYPDLVAFPGDRDGDAGFRVCFGTGNGFAESEGFATPFGYLRLNSNTCWEFGASAGSASGALRAVYSADGRPDSVSPADPEGIGASLGLSGGVHGSFGSSFTLRGFRDLNGDGLPDHVVRDGGSYSAAVNLGGAALSPARDWGGGISRDLFSGGAAARTNGLETLSLGSYGGSIRGSYTIAGSGPYLNTGFSATAQRTHAGLRDLNGDGLPDEVAKDGSEGFFRVRANLGDRFADGELRLLCPPWSVDPGAYLSRGLEADLAAVYSSLAVNIPGAVPAAPGALPDSGGNRFAAFSDPLRLDDVLDCRCGVEYSFAAGVTISVPLVLLRLTLVPGVDRSTGKAAATLEFLDVDGDGLPDHVLKLPGLDYFFVRRNLCGAVGLLKTLRLPQGGAYRFEYASVGCTRDLPFRRWVLGARARSAGSLPADRGVSDYTERYEYEGGYYDRPERDFFGFSRVTTRRADGSAALTEYHNRDYFLRGQVLRAALRDSSGTVLSETLFETEKVPVSGHGRAAVCFPARTAMERRTFDPRSGEVASNRVEYAYDFDTGNVRTLRDLGNPAAASDDVTVSLSYARLGERFRQHPESFEATDSAGRLLARTRGSYGVRGELVALDQYCAADRYSRRSLAWDDWGNPAALTDPCGSRLRWQYDADTHGYAVSAIKDNASGNSEVYESRALWDSRLGRPLWREDANGRRLAWKYDSFGRPLAVSSPYDAEDGAPSVRYEYDTGACPWTAITCNKLSHDPVDSRILRTAVSVDGLGRPLQTAAEGELRAQDGTRTFGWNLSGALRYDALGRIDAEGQPQFREGPGLPALGALSRPTCREFDGLGRPVLTTLPDGATIRIRYSVVEGLLAETTTDPLGNIRETRSDVRGNILTLARKDKNGSALLSSRYEYDALGRMLKALDARGEALSAAYDLASRRTSLSSPAAGTIQYEYDECGKLLRKTDSRLRARGECVRYAYDGHKRLVRIDYPQGADTVYEYGGSDADSRARNAADRLVSLSDRSGTARYSYGELGELRTLTRRLERLAPLAADQSATLSYEWDYLGRLQKIIYPDGEELAYGYDAGGRLSSVTGRFRGLETEYVRDIAYDAFGQRTYIEYGNGVRTEYAYDPDRRWLDEIETRSGGGRVFQDMSYDFDAAGNVLGFDNDASVYETRQRYGYDSLYRLASARGATEYRPHGVPEYTGAYEQTFSFDAAGNLVRKASTQASSPARTPGDDLAYDLAYVYTRGAERPPESIGEARYSYDANGNVIEIREGGSGIGDAPCGEIQREGEVRHAAYGFGLVRNPPAAGGVRTRDYLWDEENRLTKCVEGGQTVQYRYGSDNLRSAKRCEDFETLYFDPLWQMSFDARGVRQSKHVYAGRSRVATRQGIPGNVDTAYPRENTYYYHADHLGSAQVVTDCRGAGYQRIEYTPYGELWVEEKSDSLEKIPFRFTGKERDGETGLYYFGARYLDPKVSGWLSPDPALGDYIPSAGSGAGQNLAGLGGVYTPANLHPYHYAGYNPVKYTDPDGLTILTPDDTGNLTDTERQRGYGYDAAASLGKAEGIKDWWNNYHPEKPYRQQDIPGWDSACHFWSLNYYAQKESGRNFSFGELFELMEDAIEAGYMDEDFAVLVSGRTEILQNSFFAVGLNNSPYWDDSPNEAKGVVWRGEYSFPRNWAMIEHGVSYDPDLHFQAGYMDGSFMDPFGHSLTKYGPYKAAYYVHW